MAKKNPEAKPLLFGNTTLDTEREHAADGFAFKHFTPGAVPGYDNVVKANEIARNPTLSRARKEKLLQELGTVPRELTARVAWVRARAVDGTRSYNASIDQASWRRKGYRPATLDDLQAHGFEVPATAHVEADGTIRREDTDLWIVDESRARAFDRTHAEYNAQFHALTPVETRDADVPYIDVLEQERESITDLSSLIDR